jgi:hypothetical protein
MDFGDDIIYGIDLDPDTCDEHMQKYVRKDWVAVETALFTGKWFAYRFLHPVQATYVYAHEFTKAYRRYYRREIDRTRAEYVQPIKIKEMFTGDKSPKMSAVWRGRQIADAAGMPYDVFLDLAFDIQLRYWNQDRLPQPSHMYSDLITDKIGPLWEDRQEGFLFYSRHPNYHNSFYQGLKAQDDHHEWILAQVMKRGNATHLLNQLVYDKQVLPEDKVKARFGQDYLNRVLEAA